jgi:exonuclease VII large subunit
MTADSSLPPDNFEGEIKQARENFRTITELKEKLDILTEHVESRKEALEEEIEESLHEAVRNSRDSLEKIQENIDPKLEKVIRAKLEEIDKKMNRWKEDNVLAVKEALKQETPALTKAILWELDQVIVEKVKQVKDAIMGSVTEEVNRQVGDALKEFKEETDRNFQRVGKFNIVCLLLASLALGGLLLVASRF